MSESPPSNARDPIPSAAASIHRSRRRLNIISLFFAVLFLVPAAVAIVTRGRSLIGFEWGERVGAPIAILLIAWLLAMLIWRLAGRSNRVYNATFILLMFLMFFGRYSSEQKKKQERSKIAAAYEQYERESNRENLRRKIEGQEQTPPDITQRLAALDVIAKSAEGDEAIFAESSAIMLKEAGDLINVQLAAIQEASQTGGIDPSAISKKEEIDNRIKHYQNCLPYIEKTIQYMKQHDFRLRELLRDRGMSEQRIDQFFKSRMANENPDLAVQIQSLEKEAVLQVLKILDLLKSEWGKWTYDDQEAGLKFEDTDRSEEYSSLTEHLNSILAKQESLTKKING
jgi:hypothetical protein